MKRNILIGIIVLVLALLVAVVIFGRAVLGIVPPALIGLAMIGFWIYLVWIVRKKGAVIFTDRAEPGLAEKRYKRLKVLLLVAGIALVVGIAGVIGHNVLYGVSDIEEPVSFFFGFVGLLVFVLTVVSSIAVFVIGRRKTVESNNETSAT